MGRVVPLFDVGGDPGCPMNFSNGVQATFCHNQTVFMLAHRRPAAEERRRSGIGYTDRISDDGFRAEISGFMLTLRGQRLVPAGLVLRAQTVPTACET